MTSFDKPLPLVQSWLGYLHQQGRSSHTLKAYRRAWQHLAQWYEESYGEPCDPSQTPTCGNEKCNAILEFILSLI